MTKDEALKMALEALEDLGMKHYESTGEVLYKETFSAIKEALAQPEITTGNILMDSYNAMQSMKVEGPRHVVCQCDKCKAQPEQKPMHPQLKAMLEEYFDKCFAESAPQRTWVGLTDEEISELIRATHNTGSFVRAIEAKLKEKNVPKD